MFGSKSLRTKILSVCLLLALFTGIGGGVSYFYMNKVAAAYEHIANVNLVNTDSLGSMLATYRRVRVLMATLAIPGQSMEATQKNIALINESLEAYLKIDQKYTSVPFVPGEEAKYIPVSAAWKKFYPMVLEVIKLAEEGTSTGRERLASLFLNEGAVIFVEYTNAIDALIAFQNEESDRWVNDAHVLASQANMVIFILIMVSLTFALIIGYTFSSSLSKNLKLLAEGLAHGAEEVASASKQISDAGTELSSSATEQAAALQETVASIDEVSAMVNKNADNAKNSQELSLTSEKTATRGKQVVDEMIRSIEDINHSNTEIMQQIENSNREISDIVKVISEIGNKTKVINDIVFQTKLLSFNASVEAARAGEHGKGFAVVAEEVGNLAQMSGNAAKEISQMLEASIRKVENIVNETKSKVERLVVTGKETVSKGTTTAKRCGEVLDEIVRNVSSLSQMVGEISTASREQATGVQEITIAMGQLDQVTQTNAAASSQSANAAEQLTIQASSLHEMVATLVHTISGGKQESRSATNSHKQVGSTRSPIIDFKEKSNHRKSKLESKSKAFAGAQPVKKAVGAEDVPSENDPRFSDI